VVDTWLCTLSEGGLSRFAFWLVGGGSLWGSLRLARLRSVRRSGLGRGILAPGWMVVWAGFLLRHLKAPGIDASECRLTALVCWRKFPGPTEGTVGAGFAHWFVDEHSSLCAASSKVLRAISTLDVRAFARPDRTKFSLNLTCMDLCSLFWVGS
jgi:hypothetical protein